MSAPATGFGTILDFVLFPAMARVQGNAERLAAAYRRGIALVALVFLPTSATLVLLAPEFVAVLLGPRWAPVIAPFQILAAGMLFRCSSKISDALVRATGSVYRRAWRQILYAGLVVGGAWVGQRWGIAAVAWGVLFAITVNFLLMAQLGLRESKLTWPDLWRAHVPALLITAICTPLVWAGVGALRHAALPSLVVLGGGALLMLASALLLILFAPTTFLGPDGQWMVEAMRGFARKLMDNRGSWHPAQPDATNPVSPATGLPRLP
jgi:PST family polysaccharide transporter